MTKEQIFRKVIDKAVKNGYTGHLKYYPSVIDLVIPENKEECINEALYENYPAIIFSHSFAKTFWGTDEIDEVGRTLEEAWNIEYKDSGIFLDKDEFEMEFGFDIPTKCAWRHHLQQMVLEEDSFLYLEKFL